MYKSINFFNIRIDNLSIGKWEQIRFITYLWFLSNDNDGKSIYRLYFY